MTDQHLPGLRPLLAPGHLAKFLGKSIPSVYRLLRAGKIDAMKIGGEWRISEEALRVFLEDGIHVPSKRDAR